MRAMTKKRSSAFRAKNAPPDKILAMPMVWCHVLAVVACEIDCDDSIQHRTVVRAYDITGRLHQRQLTNL